MSESALLPEIIVFAGPNGSGKSTITRMSRTVGIYINADDIKRATLCSDLEAAQKAELMREQALDKKEDFTFETVLSTDRNLILLRKAKAQGFFIRCIYVLTANPDINVARVMIRQSQGGHGVPEDKVQDFSFDEDTVSLNVAPVGELKLRIIEREEPKCVKFETAQSPVPFNVWIQVLPVTETTSKMKVTVKAELNPFIKGMVSGPLQDGVEKIADALSRIEYV
jgi:energy-coupling factor transporter ATP-binding protein EcfA2